MPQVVTPAQITRAALAGKVPPSLFQALVRQESGGRVDARSPAGAIGPTQLMPETAAGLHVDPLDPDQNLLGGARYLAQQLARFHTPELALAAYNAGPNAVAKYGGVPPYAETQHYVRTILANAGSTPPPPPSPAPPPVRTPKPGDWTTALRAPARAQTGGSWVDALSGTTTAAPLPAAAPKPASWVDALAGKPAAVPPASEPGPLPLTQPRNVAQPTGSYPLARPAKVIGTPYHGTHTLYGNWESDNAVDLATPTGTPVVALADGTIGPQIGPLNASGDPRLAGLRVHLVTPGNEFYYAHLSRLTVKAGEKVKAGQIIGYSGAANGVQHLHFAQKAGNPLAITRA